VEAGWASQRPRPSGEGGWWLGLGERRRPRRGGGGRWAQAQKQILFEFQLILEFGRIWKIAQGDLGRNLTWGFFLKSSRLSKYFREMKYAMP
jgi:hypothetical protein